MLSLKVLLLTHVSVLYHLHSLTFAFAALTGPITSTKSSPSALTVFPPNRPPPEPWNEHLCRNPSLSPHVHLTFSFGTTISRTALLALIFATKRTLRNIINDGHGARPLLPYVGNLVVPYLGLVFVARPHKDARFTYQEISAAVDLVQWCIVDRGKREEIWAYVFVRGERVGEVSVQMGGWPDGEGSAREEVGNP
ncbi:MAG: hypothetical protein Q9184_008088 [Pyrenodesmia sp. 2 TL-2023]